MKTKITVSVCILFLLLAAVVLSANLKIPKNGHLLQQFQLNPGGEENIAFERKAFLKWIKNESFQFSLGYGLMYGEYPFGTQRHLLSPLFDVKWARQIW